MPESIDIFCHWLPRKFIARVQACSTRPLHMFDRAAAMPAMVDLEARLRVMDEFPGYTQVPSIASPPVEAVGVPAVACELAQLANDEQAAIVARHPDRFPGFVAVLPMNDPDGAMREATRAIRELGAVGVQIFSNINGRPLDEPEFLEVIRHVTALGCPIWLHPIRGMDPDYRAEAISRFDLWWAFGWPYETSVAMGRLVFSGVLAETPALLPSGPLRGYKADTWEGGHRVPFIVRWPGVVKAGARCDRLVHQTDLMATFAEVLGAKLPANAGEDSMSLLPLLRGSDKPVREYAVSVAQNGLPSLRKGSWKIIFGEGGGGYGPKPGVAAAGQLYDLAADIGETKNLWAGKPGLVAELTATMEKLVAAHPNDVPFDWRRFLATPQ